MMIGQITELSLNASLLGLIYEQLTWPQEEDEFARLRDEANRFLRKMEIDARIPDTREKFGEELSSINSQILERLMKARQVMLGDTVALPLFLLNSVVYRAAATAPLGLDWQNAREIINDCIDDLGIPAQVISHLERELGWVSVTTDETGDIAIRRTDAIRAGASFIQRVFEEFQKKEDSIQGNQQVIKLLGEVRSEVREFRDEYRRDARHLVELLKERNAEVVSVISDVQERLISAGIGKAKAVALTEKDPEGFWDSVMRWASGVSWSNVAEEALWAALDFAPGGTGVKLGIKLCRVVRKATKKKK